MTISLKPETEKLVEEGLRDGRYHSAEDIVHAGLVALKELEEHALDDETLDAIDRAEDQIDSGQVHGWSEVRDMVRAKFLGK